MGSVIQKKLRRLEKVVAQINLIVRSEVIKEQKLIARMNREQLMSGTKADGSSMPNYVEGSRQPQAPGKIKLFEEGLFHEGIEPLFSDLGVEMVGLDFKTEFLEPKYGNILGLTSSNIKKLITIVRPRILARIRRILI